MTEKIYENVQYHLEIYEPGSCDDVWVYFKTSKPLFSISRGDIINPVMWPHSQAPMKVLRVVAVEHIFWKIEDSHIGDKLCVFTEEVEGTRELRLSPRQDFKRRFDYGQVEFLYDHRDYENIPGLQRPWDDGFLTPVFFNLAVLNKYSQHPDYRLDLFSKTYGSIDRKDEFDISFGINRNRKVIMWLGDIDKLPLNEQYYLRSENVDSDHDLCSEFYESHIEIEVQFSNPSPENALFHARSEAVQACQKKRQGYLHTFEGEISKVIENLDRPVFWQEKHVSPVIEALNRVMVESLDSQFLKNELKNLVNKDELKGLRSLKLFERWLEKVLQISDFSDVSLPFYVLYDFRILSSHLTSDSKKKETLESLNKRLKLLEGNENYEVIYDALIHRLRESYEVILVQLQA